MSEQTAVTINPPKLGVNLEWEAKGTGFDLRRITRKGRKLRNAYLCHLTLERWQKLQAKHSGDELTEALRAWVKGVRRSITGNRLHVGIASR